MLISTSREFTNGVGYSNSKQDKEITITELALEMPRGFREMQDQSTGLQGEFTGLKDQFTGLETYVRHRFQSMSDKVDIVDGRLEHVERDVKEVRSDIEDLTTGMFTRCKKKVFWVPSDTYDRRLEDEVHGEAGVGGGGVPGGGSGGVGPGGAPARSARYTSRFV